MFDPATLPDGYPADDPAPQTCRPACRPWPGRSRWSAAEYTCGGEPGLTTDQLAALAFSNLTTARHRLSVLVRLGVLRRFRPRRETGSAPWHYVLGPIGAALLGQEDRDDRKWAPQVRADRQLALERSQRLGHMTGASWFFAALARHARTHGGGELLRWDSERETAEFLYFHNPGTDSSPHPDGFGIWAEDDRDIAFMLEYDTGTEHLPQLASKLLGYAEHARRNIAFKMPVLFCFPTPRREQTARKALAATRASHGLQIATAALDPRVTCPACETTWMPLHGGHAPMRLIDLADVLPDPWRLAREQEERERREKAGRSQDLPGNSDDDDEDPIPEGPAPQVSGEVNRVYGGPGFRTSGRAAR
jgi:hypothetical protein